MKEMPGTGIDALQRAADPTLRCETHLSRSGYS